MVRRSEPAHRSVPAEERSAESMQRSGWPELARPSESRVQDNGLEERRAEAERWKVGERSAQASALEESAEAMA